MVDDARRAQDDDASGTLLNLKTMERLTTTTTTTTTTTKTTKRRRRGTGDADVRRGGDVRTRLEGVFEAAAGVVTRKDESDGETLVRAKVAADAADNDDDDDEVVRRRRAALVDAMSPETCGRATRRALAEYEKTFTCGVDGCEKSYGSAPSLCAHRRARHPGWRGSGKVPTPSGIVVEGGGCRDKAAVDGVDVGDDDVDFDVDADAAATRAARKRGASGLDAASRSSAVGAYLEILAADAHDRLNTSLQSRRKVSRAMKEAMDRATNRDASVERRAVDACASRVFASMENCIDVEQKRASAWLDTLDHLSKAFTSTNDASLRPNVDKHDASQIMACLSHDVARDIMQALREERAVAVATPDRRE